jgi:hypothetical protein
MFLPVCKPPHQFARLVAEGPDAEALKLFSKYISKKTQVWLIHVIYYFQLDTVATSTGYHDARQLGREFNWCFTIYSADGNVSS